MGRNPSKQPWSPHGSETEEKSSAGVTAQAVWAAEAAVLPAERVTWDGLVGPRAEDLFDRVTVDGELLPACPICLRGLHIHKGLLVDRHNLQGKHKCPLVSILLQSYLLPGGERDLLPVLLPASGHQLLRVFLSPALQLSAHLPCISLFNLLLNPFPSALCIVQQQRAPEPNHVLVKGTHPCICCKPVPGAFCLPSHEEQ